MPACDCVPTGCFASVLARWRVPREERSPAPNEPDLGRRSCCKSALREEEVPEAQLHDEDRRKMDLLMRVDTGS